MTGSILDKYLRDREPQASPKPKGDSSEPVSDADGTETIGCFGWHRGTRDHPRMLELRKKDGSITAIPYAWMERVEFDPEDGITILAHGKQTRITGHNLNAAIRPTVRLFEGIVRQRVSWVQEASGSVAGTDPHEIEVAQIMT